VIVDTRHELVPVVEHVATISAFFPVVPAEAPPQSSVPSMMVGLHVRLPNGVEFDIGQTTALVAGRRKSVGHAPPSAAAVLVFDGYELYNGIAHNHQLVHLGCWAHARRAFVKAGDTVPKAARTPDLLATHFIALIGKLFVAERRSEQLDAARRQRLRNRYSVQVLAKIGRMLLEHLPLVVPSSMTGNAAVSPGPMASILTRISPGCSPACLTPAPLTTMKPCCLGICHCTALN
jgi:hypothetical protein